MYGGLGNDTFYVVDAGDTIFEFGEGIDEVRAVASAVLASNVENLRIVGVGAVAATGNSLNNIIYAGPGNNVLNGDSGVDTVSYADATTGVTTSLAVTTAQATGGSGTDTLTDFENLAGSAHADKLTGSAAANVLDGGASSDTLDGGAGADTMSGGDDSDAYYVDHAGDVVVVSNASAARSPVTDGFRGGVR